VRPNHSLELTRCGSDCTPKLLAPGL